MRHNLLRPHQSQHHHPPFPRLHLRLPLPHPQDLLVFLSCLRLPLRHNLLRPHQSQHHCLSLGFLHPPFPHFPHPFPQPEDLPLFLSFLWLPLRHNRLRLQTPLLHRQYFQPHLSFLHFPLPHPQDLLVLLSCLRLSLQPHLPNLQLHRQFLQAHLLLRLLRAVHPRHHLPHNPLHLQAHNHPPTFRLPYFRPPHLRRLLHHQINPRIFLRCFFPLQHLPHRSWFPQFLWHRKLSRLHHLVRRLLFLVRPPRFLL